MATIEITPKMAKLLLEARKYNREFISRRAARIHQREEYIKLSQEEKMQKRGGFNRDKPEISSWAKWKACEADLGASLFFLPLTDSQLREIANATEDQREDSEVVDEERPFVQEVSGDGEGI